MQTKPNHALWVIHLVLMILVGAANLFMLLVELLSNALSHAYGSWENIRMIVLFGSLVNGISAVAVSFGIIYVLMHYSERAIGYFRGFLLLAAAADVVFAAGELIALLSPALSKVLAVTELGMTVFYVILYLVQVVALCLLALLRDLSKRSAWILLLVVAACDLVIALLPGNTIISNGSLLLSALLDIVAINLAIALTIKGKYDSRSSLSTS